MDDDREFLEEFERRIDGGASEEAIAEYNAVERKARELYEAEVRKQKNELKSFSPVNCLDVVEGRVIGHSSYGMPQKTVTDFYDFLDHDGLRGIRESKCSVIKLDSGMELEFFGTLPIRKGDTITGEVFPANAIILKYIAYGKVEIGESFTMNPGMPRVDKVIPIVYRKRKMKDKEKVLEILVEGEKEELFTPLPDINLRDLQFYKTLEFVPGHHSFDVNFPASSNIPAEFLEKARKMISKE